jgi:threonine 3-dehydrogenase
MAGQRTILITGGTGFIASYLAMKFLESDANTNVVLFDRNPDLRRLQGFKSSVAGVQDRYTPVKDRITFVQGDLTHLSHILALFETHQPDSVFHLGALLSAGAETNPTMGFEVDLVGSRHVLEAARLFCQKSAQPPIRVLFPSTIASFGKFVQSGPLGVPNEAVQMPTTMYGISKVSVERLGEYYTAKTWVDFRAVRFPSVIGASRGPGGTTVYSTLMIQLPAQGKPYTVYVRQDTPLDIIYVADAVAALLGLHDANNASLKRRVYNIAGIRKAAGQAPLASDIATAVTAALPAAQITFNQNDSPIEETVRGFGILDDTAAQQDWGWPATPADLTTAVNSFVQDVQNYPDRILALELFG